MKKIIMIILSICLLSSCSNVENDNVSKQANTNNNDIKISINETEVFNNLKSICSEPRAYNTKGEENALVNLKDKLDGYGYISTIQEFPVYKQTFESTHGLNGVQSAFDPNPYKSEKLGIGKNLIVKKNNYDENKKNIYITAHYDTTKNTYGAMDNGSGVSVVLETANQLKSFISNYNIVFVFFSAEEYYMTGSKAFVASLSDIEKKNTIGCINVDMVGEKDAGHLEIRTINSENNILSTLFNKNQNEKLPIGYGGSSDDISFYLAKIPSITLADSSPDPKRGKEQDHIKYINPNELKKVAELVCKFLIQFDDTIYNKILNNKNEVPSNIDIKKQKPHINNPAEEQYNLIKTNSILIDNGYASKTKYYYKNEVNKEFTITEQDEKFITEEQINNTKKFDIKDENNNCYKIIKDEKGNSKGIYKINGRYGEITGEINEKEIEKIMKTYYKNRYTEN